MELAEPPGATVKVLTPGQPGRAGGWLWNSLELLSPCWKRMCRVSRLAAGVRPGGGGSRECPRLGFHALGAWPRPPQSCREPSPTAGASLCALWWPWGLWLPSGLSSQDYSEGNYRSRAEADLVPDEGRGGGCVHPGASRLPSETLAAPAWVGGGRWCALTPAPVLREWGRPGPHPAALSGEGLGGQSVPPGH